MSQGQFNTFSKADIKTWTEAAKKELGGKDPFQSQIVSKGKIDIKPYYDQSDTSTLPEDILAPTSNPYLGPRGWYNAPNVVVKDNKEANKEALLHLNNGADAIQFTIEAEIQVEVLLANIELPYCGIFFLMKSDQTKLLIDFEQYVNAKGFDKSQIVGAVFWTKPPALQNIPVQSFSKWPGFHVLGHIIPESDPITEISNALLAGTRCIQSDMDNQPDLIISQSAFSFSIGKDFFMEIAKLKAFRRLWRQVSHAYQVTDKDDSVLIHGSSAPWNNEKFQPNANMLKSTTAALSAVLGGCNAITVEPEEHNTFKARIARNVLTLLREESHLNITADPTAGSYYLEHLIDQLAQSAWTKFQQDIA